MRVRCCCRVCIVLVVYVTCISSIHSTYLYIDEFGTHKVLQEGLSALACMEHRGACGGDGVSGDGAGIMTQIPWKLFEEFQSRTHVLNQESEWAFCREMKRDAKQVMEMMEDVCRQNELDWLGWREVPVESRCTG